MNPIRYDYDFAVFSKDQLDIFGLPDISLYPKYYIIEEPWYQEYTIDPQFLKDRETIFKDKHRYNRIERFRTTFLQLMGVRGDIDKIIDKIYPEFIREEQLLLSKVYSLIQSFCHSQSWSPLQICIFFKTQQTLIYSIYIQIFKLSIYNILRKILKRLGYSKYYNRIQNIIHALGFSYTIIIKDVGYETIENDFIQLSYKFDRWKLNQPRKYFPSIKFICFKLMQKYSSEFQYHIPFIRTKKKYQLLESLYSDLINF
jgi:hypothetical protein